MNRRSNSVRTSQRDEQRGLWDYKEERITKETLFVKEKSIHDTY